MNFIPTAGVLRAATGKVFALFLLIILSACAGEDGPQLHLEQHQFALGVCAVDEDCPAAPPCTVARCAAGECRYLQSDPLCCVDNDDCNPYNDCLVGTCQAGPEETGTCIYTDHPDKPDCCNYTFDCPLPPPGYVALCEEDPEAGYPKCDYIVDPESCSPPIQQLVINEFMANPMAADDATGEWIELFNPTLDPIYLNGYSLQDEDADNFTLVSASPLVVEPGGYFVLGRSDNQENNGHLQPDFVYYNFTLSNGTDEIILVDAQGVEVDRVEYGPDDFATVEGASYELVSPYMANNDPVNWQIAQKPRPPYLDKGTPGSANTDTFFFYYTPVVCNDGNSCTLDTCGDWGESRCTHSPIDECCLYHTDCDDDNFCTIDSCQPENLKCNHTPVVDCCNEVSDCTGTTTCTYATCANHGCRYHVYPEKPGCCEENSECQDINPCTIDYCTQDPGIGYETCHHKSPGGVECCMVDLDCDDGTNDTVDTCVDHACQHSPNPEFCVGPPPDYCNDADPCTADSCNMQNNLCVHTLIADCCKDNQGCDDDNPCTQDVCQIAIHECVHSTIPDCCHTDADCEQFLTDQDLCKIPLCVDTKCRKQHIPDWNCCLTNADCTDGDACTDDVCNPGNNTCTHTPKGKGCCNTVADCSPDDDPCTEAACIKNECLTLPVKGCCKGDWQCDDADPCTADHCLEYRCRYAADPASNCCLVDGDCPSSCSSCLAVTCQPGHYCTEELVPDCTVHPNWQESFSCPHALTNLGWTTVPAELGAFSRTSGSDLLGLDGAAVLAFDASVSSGTSCLRSPLISILHPEDPVSLSFEQAVGKSAADEATVPTRFVVAALPLGQAQAVKLASFDGSSVDGTSPYAITLPAKIKSGPFRVLFCAEVPQGSPYHTWAIDSVRVGKGRPPRFLNLPDDVWMLPGEELTLLFNVQDADGDALDFQLTGPANASIGQVQPGLPGEAKVHLDLTPKGNADLGVHTVALNVSDGFFMDRREFVQTVYVPQCEVSADCDDGNFCTEDICNPVKGCENPLVPGCCNPLTPCDDGDFCTTDTCVDNGCLFAPVDCDDGNLCTDDQCDPETGCLHPFNNVSCDDDNVCTWHDLCYKGECIGLPVDCSDDLSCTLDTCNPETGCQHKSLCSDSVLCTTDICTSQGCKSGKVPVGSPTVEGTLSEGEWPTAAIQGSGLNSLGEVSLLLDELNLYVAATVVPQAESGVALFVDRDFGAATGPADLATITALDSGMDAMLAPAMAVSFPGFGADFVVAFQWGEDPLNGLVAGGCFELTAAGEASYVPCGLAVSVDGTLEATIPWYLLYGNTPLSGKVSALLAAHLDSAGAVLDSTPPTNLGIVSDIHLFGIPDPMCLVSFCGDGIMDAGEECDDGELNSDDVPDSCRTNCVLAHCGDGLVDTGEECDDGDDNNDFVPDHCRQDCKLPYCGDNVQDSDEQCDDGDDNSDETPDACRTDCVAATCGDSIVDSLEECDNGDDNSDLVADACRLSCLLPHCGDGVVDSEEECDDGPFNSDEEPDACRVGCIDPWCGDGIQDGGEECDNGDNNSDEVADACRTDCEPAHCGDGVLDTGEECDDGNLENWDGCQDDCTIYVTVCGDGIQTPNEECDDGDDNSDELADACRSDCTLAHCGDGVIDTGELCDDGNLEGGDECGLDCKPYVAFCGNGWVDDGEECDDGDDNGTTPDACRPDCVLPFCGDGIIDSNEECDKGAANSDEMPNACRKNCLLAHCGDSVIDAGEECDDGEANADAPNTCKTTCVAPACGDTYLDDALGEECDWGDDNSNETPDSCRETCLNPSCGDGTIDSGEECDDGLLNSDEVADACRSSCQPAHCGDNVQDAGEECDDGQANADAANACKTNCVAPTCGDGILDDALGEECDWAEFNANEPDSCRSTCLLPACQDGIVDGGEECDDGNDVLGDGCAPDCTIESYVPDPGDVIITEVMQNPAKVYDTLGEYFEVYNTRDFDIDINGWEITDAGAEAHIITNGAPLLVPANGYLVLGIEADVGFNGGVPVDYQYSDILLGNGSDEIILGYKGAVSDQVAYDGGPLFPDPKGAAMNLSPLAFDHVANDDGSHWCEATSTIGSGDKGTPGQPNDPCP